MHYIFNAAEMAALNEARAYGELCRSVFDRALRQHRTRTAAEMAAHAEARALAERCRSAFDLVVQRSLVSKAEIESVSREVEAGELRQKIAALLREGALK